MSRTYDPVAKRIHFALRNEFTCLSGFRFRRETKRKDREIDGGSRLSRPGGVSEAAPQIASSLAAATGR